jgi:hypothetical protein
MADNTQPLKLATNLPAPPTLSSEDLQQIRAEGLAWSAAVERGTASLERLTADDLRIRLR